MPIYDITLDITPTMVRWPGDPPIEIKGEKSVARDGYALSSVCFGTHTGTHIDAPGHMVDRGLGPAQIPLDTLIGKAYVLDVVPERGLAIQVEDLLSVGVPPDAVRILLKTPNSDLWHRGPQAFETHFIYLAKRTARWLAQRGTKLVGVDYLSVDPFPDDNSAAHLELLNAGVVILEGLNLSAVTPGVYHLVALPLKIAVPDGAPVRAVLMR